MQPYYVIDRTRKSLDAEMRIPNNVREACRNREKPLKGMCALPILFEESEISADSAISYTVLRLNEKHHLGDQYDWLARLAKQLGISNLEI